MSNPDRHVDADLSDFSGSASLFPLPNAVFFPQTLFPLHIFERRYRKMTEDALAGDRLIAMALLEPGWELLADDVPPIHPIVCLSMITAEKKLPDGRYHLVLQGLSRARVVGEEQYDLPYRVGQLDLCLDDESDLTEAENQRIREDLLRSHQLLHPDLAVHAMSLLGQGLSGNLPLGVFCDVLASALGLPPAESQRILAEQNVLKRGRLVLDAMKTEDARRQATPLHFPPKFSRN